MKNLFFLLFAALFLTACPPLEEQEIVVIGGGLMGSATAWQLAEEGHQVLLIEQQDTVYTTGSSQGTARIARSSNRGDDIWSYLHNRSVAEVEQLIDFLNTSVSAPTYKMSDIYTTSPVSYLGRMRIYDKLHASLIRQKVDYKMATSPEEGEAMFGVNLPDSVLLQREYNLHSGTINPAKLIEYLHIGIQKKGGQIWYNQRVTDLAEKQGNYWIALEQTKTKEKQLIVGKKVISAVGPYTGELLKKVAPYFKKLIDPQRVFLAFFKPTKAQFDSYTPKQKEQLFNGYPVINSMAGTRQGSFFSMIEKIDKQGIPLIKIGGHFQRSPIKDLDKIWTKKLSTQEIAWSTQNTLDYFHLLNVPIEANTLELVDSYSCVYSLTSTEVPYVTHIPLENKQRNPNFIVLGGLSGVGGKGAMAYGCIAANLLLNKEEPDTMYQSVQKRLGFERLLREVRSQTEK